MQCEEEASALPASLFPLPVSVTHPVLLSAPTQQALLLPANATDHALESVEPLLSFGSAARSRPYARGVERNAAHTPGKSFLVVAILAWGKIAERAARRKLDDWMDEMMGGWHG